MSRQRRSKIVSRVSAGAVLALACSFVNAAHAQSAAAAEALFDEGRAAMDAKNYELACRRFRESNRLDPAVGTILNLAVCEEDRGKVATAWELFTAAVEKMDAADPRREFTSKHLASIEPRLPKLTLSLATSAPEGTTVRDGETEYSSASFGVPLPMDPGKHVLIASAPGYAAHEIDVDLTEGKATTIEVAPGALSEATPGPIAPTAPMTAASVPPISAPPLATSDVPPTAAPQTANKKRIVGFVVGGVGVVGVGVGLTTGILALGKKNDTNKECNDQTKTCSPAGVDAANAGRTLAAVSTVSWIAGVAALGAGAYLVLTSKPKANGDVPASTALELGVDGLRVRRSF